MILVSKGTMVALGPKALSKVSRETCDDPDFYETAASQAESLSNVSVSFSGPGEATAKPAGNKQPAGNMPLRKHGVCQHAASQLYPGVYPVHLHTSASCKAEILLLQAVA